MVTRFQPNSSRIFRQTSDLTSASTGRVAEQSSSDSWDEDGKLGGGLATSHIPTAMLIWWWTTGSRVSMTMEPCDCDILDHRGIPVIAVMGCDYNLYCSSCVQSLPCSDLPLFRQQLFQINRSRHVGRCGERFEGWMLLRGTGPGESGWWWGWWDPGPGPGLILRYGHNVASHTTSHRTGHNVTRR